MRLTDPNVIEFPWDTQSIHSEQQIAQQHEQAHVQQEQFWNSTDLAIIVAAGMSFLGTVTAAWLGLRAAQNRRKRK